MKLVVDIDGTICHSDGGYENSIPYQERINIINARYDAGDYIVYCTARGMASTNNNVQEAYSKYYELTKGQLERWGAKHHELFLGKPSGDLYIDDRGMHCDTFFGSAK